ncbi:hypothetical protein EYF80_017931 [Liparis tanakae]|uniref:Uncharacterized protein n=1 Tax=Liparis tanakae TaxID=230148 RepID=A0A4Z2I3N5_9TELE|nr:hypothetical protein EYF80_017931 [Liparis tanakae]
MSSLASPLPTCLLFLFATPSTHILAPHPVSPLCRQLIRKVVLTPSRHRFFAPRVDKHWGQGQGRPPRLLPTYATQTRDACSTRDKRRTAHIFVHEPIRFHSEQTDTGAQCQCRGQGASASTYIVHTGPVASCEEYRPLSPSCGSPPPPPPPPSAAAPPPSVWFAVPVRSERAGLESQQQRGASADHLKVMILDDAGEKKIEKS